MTASARRSLCLGLLSLLAACAAPTPRPWAERAERMAAPISAPKSLTLAIEGEPGNLVSGMEGGGISPTDFADALQHRLAGYNDVGEPIAQIAVALPSVERGSWVVRSDGSMETTYRLRPGVTWHDGRPVAAQDFVLAWTVHRDPALPIAGRRIATLIDRIDTPDDLTLVMAWKATYPFAHAINQDELGPLPVHILQAEYEGDKQRFPALPYWKREFVGTGPYRLAEWVPGSHMVTHAYGDFYGGRPRIDSIILRFIPDGSTALANLLAGTVDGSIEAIDFNQVMFARDELERAGRKPTLVLVPTHWRFLSMQFRPDVVRPRELLDARTRRALLHAIDRKALADTMLAGASPIADTFITPSDLRWDWVKDVVVRYEHDPRQTQLLLEEIGWRRAADGRVVDAAGQPVAIALWTTAGEANESETNIVADFWRQVGLAVDQFVVPQAQQRDRRLRASYPGFDTTSVPLRFENTVHRAYSVDCPTADNSWVGNNRGCYQTAAMDRVVEGLRTAIEPAEQRRLYRELVQLHMQELPVLSMYFSIHADIFREGITGIRAASYLVRVPWNIAEWDIR